MTTYILRRFLLMIPTLFGITLLTFCLIRLAPGNAALIKGGLGNPNGGRAQSAEAMEARIKLYGLDKDPVTGYFIWLGKLARLNLGESVVDHRFVLDKIAERVPVTLGLNLTALAISYSIAIPLGILVALRRGQGVDRSINFILFALYSTPTFVAAMILILFVASGDYLNLLPMYGLHAINAPEMSNWAWGFDLLKHIILPVICLTYGSLASLSRYSRMAILEALGQDFIRTARAKGLPEGRVIFHHALRNAIIPLITLLAMELPGLISGSVIVESIFTLPGMGQLALQAITARDTEVIMGIVTISAVITLFSYLIADLLYLVVDPRIRLN